MTPLTRSTKTLGKALADLFFRKEPSPGEEDLKLAQKAGFKVLFRAPTSQDVGLGNLFFHHGYLFRPVYLNGELFEFAFQPSLNIDDKARLQKRQHNATFRVSFA